MNAKDTSSKQVAGGASIIIIDDNPSDRILVQRYLTDAEPDLTIVFANSGEEAFGFMEGQDFDCAIVDYKLPGMSGNELAAKLTRGDSGKVVPVVMLTGYDDESSVTDALHSGVAVHLSKNNLTSEAIQHAVFNTISLGRSDGEIKSRKSSGQS